MLLLTSINQQATRILNEIPLVGPWTHNWSAESFVFKSGSSWPADDKQRALGKIHEFNLRIDYRGIKRKLKNYLILCGLYIRYPKWVIYSI